MHYICCIYSTHQHELETGISWARLQHTLVNTTMRQAMPTWAAVPNTTHETPLEREWWLAQCRN